MKEYVQKSKHVLCSWHANQNVQASTRKFFATLAKYEGFCLEHAKFHEAWAQLISSPTSTLYRARLEEFKNSFYPIPLVKRVVDTWLLREEKLGACWFDEIPYSRNRTTNRFEGMHKTLKDFVEIFVRDMKTVFDRLSCSGRISELT